MLWSNFEGWSLRIRAESHGDWQKDGPRQTSHRIQPSHALACRFEDFGGGFKITRLEEVTFAAQRGGGGLEPFGISPRDETWCGLS